MTTEEPTALARLDAYLARLQELRDLAVADVLDPELVYRASQDDRGVLLCWCGYDMNDHAGQYGARKDAPAQHAYEPCGTNDVAWLLGVTRDDATPFEHDHDRTAEIEALCVLCRIEAARTQK